MKLEFGKELIAYIKDGIKGEGKTFILHHFLRGVEITLGSTIQNTLSVVETCAMAIIAGYTIQELKLSPDVNAIAEKLNISLTVASIAFTTLKEITMLAMATVRSIAQELRNIKTVKGE